MHTGKGLARLLVSDDPRHGPGRLQGVGELRLDGLGFAEPVADRQTGGDKQVVVGEIRMAEVQVGQHLLRHNRFDPEAAVLVGRPGNRPVFEAMIIIVLAVAAAGDPLAL